MSVTKIRPATQDDIHLIFAFIQKKADFDRSVGAFAAALQTSEHKIQRTLFGSIPFAHVLFAEQQDQPVGFALYGFRYSSFIGQPSIWLDDLYVNPQNRSQGIGAALMQRLAQIAVDQYCTHMAWTADARNQRGLEFYHRLGAKMIRQEEQRCFWQWTAFKETP